MHNISTISDQIASRLRQDDRIAAAYLLGSVGTPRFGHNSDVDCAILLKCGATMEASERLVLAMELEDIVHHPVDLGVLNHLNLVYAKEALMPGRCIVCQDRAYRDLFVATTLSLYTALRADRKEVEDAYAA